MFNVGQRAAVASAFRLAGFDAVPGVAPIDSEDERLFVLDGPWPLDDASFRDLEQVLTQLLGRKVAVLRRSASWSPVTQPFE